jgi:hypothetical protein
MDPRTGIVVELDEGWFDFSCYKSLCEEFDDAELA